MHWIPGSSTVCRCILCDSCFEFASRYVCRPDIWLSCTEKDHKSKSIEYSHATCLWIVQIHCVYVHVMGIFALFLFFSQVDFAVIRLVADLLVTGYSTVWFIQVWTQSNALCSAHAGISYFIHYVTIVKK